MKRIDKQDHWSDTSLASVDVTHRTGGCPIHRRALRTSGRLFWLRARCLQASLVPPSISIFAMATTWEMHTGCALTTMIRGTGGAQRPSGIGSVDLLEQPDW